MNVTGNVRLPWLRSLIEFFDFSFEIEFFTNVEQSLFPLSIFSEISHWVYSYLTILLESPWNQIPYSLIVSEVAFLKELVAEKVQTTWDKSSGIVKTLNTCNQRDLSFNSCDFILNFIFGKSCCFSLNQIVKLIIFIVNKLETSTSVK